MARAKQAPPSSTLFLLVRHARRVVARPSVDGDARAVAGVDVRTVQRVDPRMQRGVAAADHRGDDVVGNSLDQPRGANRRDERSAAIDGLDAERRDQPPVILAVLGQRSDRPIGDLIGRVEVGLIRIVLDLDVDPHSRARVERSREGGDMALRLVELLVDRTAAQAAQLMIEYDPQPPFDNGALAKCDDEIVTRVIEYAQVRK